VVTAVNSETKEKVAIAKAPFKSYDKGECKRMLRELKISRLLKDSPNVLGCKNVMMLPSINPFNHEDIAKED